MNQASGVLWCYHGSQACEDGRWSDCQDGIEQTQIDPTYSEESDQFEIQAYSTPMTCVDNPCDPSCQMFDEDPPDINDPGTPGMGTPGPPPSWSTPPGTAPCAHDLCTVDPAPLDPTCHPCVAAVCAAEPSCCTTGMPADDWDQTCVDAVYTECVGTMPPPPVVPPPPGGSICDYAIFTEGDLSAGNRLQVTGPIGADGNINLQSGLPAFLDDVYSTGTVNTQDIPTDNVYVTGSAGDVSGSAISAVHPMFGYTLPVIPTRTLSCIPTGIQVHTNGFDYTASQAGTANPHVSLENRRDIRWEINNGASTVTFKDPGDYGGVNTSAGTIRFQQGGRYTFSYFQPKGSNPLIEVPADGSRVFIDVCGDVEFDNGARMRKIGGGAPDPGQVVIYTNDSDNLKVGVGAEFHAILIAPHANITGQGAGGDTINAMIFANSMSVNTDFRIDASAFVGDACNWAGIDPNYCDGFAPWAAGTTYNNNDQAMNMGEQYECFDAPNGGLAAYEPGVGPSWSAAWTHLGACPAGGMMGPPPACPVTLTIPGTSDLTTACYEGTDCQNNTR